MLDPTSSDPLLRQVSSVELVGVRPDPNPGQLVYDPGHPDANGDGYVEYPNVNVVTEMVNLMTASRAYEAGVTTIESIKGMARSAMRFGRWLIMDPIRFSPELAGFGQVKSLSDYEGATTLGGLTGTATGPAPSVSFSEVLGGVVEQASALGQVAETKIQGLAAGTNDDLHGTMISLKEAEISMKLVGSIRSKVLEAFHELWRTSV